MRQMGSMNTQHMEAAKDIVASLPEPDYPVNYQPTYRSKTALTEAVAEVASTHGVTTPRQADEYTEQLASVSERSDGSVVITAGCRETIHVDIPISQLVEGPLKHIDVIEGSGLVNVVAAQRNRGQYTKPRSKGMITLPDGSEVEAYMGDNINGEAIEDRTPDPSRLVAGIVQARDLEAELTARTGLHIPAIHEALSLPYEKALISTDPTTGKQYSRSADALWAGLRTNQVDGPVVDLLSGIENTVGVKIGANSDEAHIAGLAERLNPDNRAGKLIFMLRLGLKEIDNYPTILGAIKKHAPNSISIFDIHGSTVTQADGTKIRHVGTIIKGMVMMSRATKEAGVNFGGVGLETTAEDARFECIDEIGQQPMHEGGIDPQLNPRQTVRVLNALARIKQY